MPQFSTGKVTSRTDPDQRAANRINGSCGVGYQHADRTFTIRRDAAKSTRVSSDQQHNVLCRSVTWRRYKRLYQIPHFNTNKQANWMDGVRRCFSWRGKNRNSTNNVRRSRSENRFPPEIVRVPKMWCPPRRCLKSGARSEVICIPPLNDPVVNESS